MTDHGIGSVSLAQERLALLRKLKGTGHSDLTLSLLLPCLLKSGTEADAAHSRRHLEAHGWAIGVAIDIVSLLVLLDDSRLSLPLLGGKHGEAAQHLVLSLELDLVVLDLVQEG